MENLKASDSIEEDQNKDIIDDLENFKSSILGKDVIKSPSQIKHAMK